jgi:(1->4)-alpha-D-glucan 1-alpha-D-glucosylmutase
MNSSTVTAPLAEGLPSTQAFYGQLQERRRLPVSTYRLQLHSGFTFRDARQLVPYLAKLGITDCYCSPYLRARPGSQHGYDICDHNQLNPEIGTEEDYEAFVTELKNHQMGQVLDLVPNHMAVDPLMNKWWRDVLEDGQASPFASFFDIDWAPVKAELKGKVLLPVLGDHYGVVLERGELQLAMQDGALVLRYGDLVLPIDPRESPRVLRLNLESLQRSVKEDDADLQEFLSILTALDHLPPRTETTPERIDERHREKAVARARLARLLGTCPTILKNVEESLKQFNGVPGKPETFDRLHQLLEAQPYRLAFWKTAFHEINYRRFFDIKELAGVRMENANVFAATHELIFRLVREGKVNGLRLDHLDGLYDPAGYLERLQETVVLEWLSDLRGSSDRRGSANSAPSLVISAAGSGDPRRAPDEAESWRQKISAWREQERKNHPGGLVERPLYVVAEKILCGNEALPESWPIHGTSGYDFMNDLNRLFVNPQNFRAMRRIYERFTDQTTPFADVVYTCKKLITRTALASELNVLAHSMNLLSEGNRRARDFTLESLREALQEVVACFPVYRTYVNASGAAESDRQMIDLALARARRRNPAMEPSVFDFLRDVLMARPHPTPPPPEGGGQEGGAEDEYQRRLNFAMKFQQYSGPVQAKGVEDTAFYRYNVLLSLNEVGGDPQRFGGTPVQFHEANQRRLQHWPWGMIGTSTHDTKRGEDARARLNVLSEIPQEWRRQVFQWSRINARNRTEVDGQPAPDRNTEYLFYQALLGAWPADGSSPSPLGGEGIGARGTANKAATPAPPELVERLREYMHKAIKEAKVHTSWINPYEAYDQAVANFVDKTLAGPRARRFLDSFLPFQRRVAHLGMVNSLAQVVLKVVSPGVPDFYQGTELWDLSLVDPDNRRPVDYARRTQLLEEIQPWLEDGDQRSEVRSQKSEVRGQRSEARGQKSEVLTSDFRSLTSGKAEAVTEMLQHWEDGRIKLYLTVRGLRIRRWYPQVFLEGEYLPLAGEGEQAEHVFALARRHSGKEILAVVTRLPGAMLSPPTISPDHPHPRAGRGGESMPPPPSPGHTLPVGSEIWKQTRIILPADFRSDSFFNLFTGENVQAVRQGGGLSILASDVLAICPVALLENLP